MLQSMSLISPITIGLTGALLGASAMAGEAPLDTANATAEATEPQKPKPVLEQIGEEAQPLVPVDVLDLNHDGVLSTTEANHSPDLMTRWEVLDTNSDGLLDRSEMAFMYDEPPPTAAEAPR